ncbi:hypothetical protein QJR52_02775 [Clostridium baratii]|uniref:hypothetical protein n=1 Tax=Clostridium baratii TaxID=1561 RepID=UPI0030CEB702
MQYNMKTLTRDELVELIKNGDDSYDNQIRVTKDGMVFLSRIVGAENISGLKFRFETFDAGNGYVGPDAAKDEEYIDDLYRALIESWKLNRTGYIDYWG